jgi:hypothetical protein
MAHTSTDYRATITINPHLFRLFVVCSTLGLVLCLGLGYALIVERAQRRRAVNDSLCALVNVVPPGYKPVDNLRARYHCGPYNGPPRPTPTPTVTVTVRRPS